MKVEFNFSLQSFLCLTFLSFHSTRICLIIYLIMTSRLQQIWWAIWYPTKIVVYIFASCAVGLTALDQWLYRNYGIDNIFLRAIGVILSLYTMIVLLIWAYWRVQLDKLRESELSDTEIQINTRQKTSVFLSVTWIINVLFSFYYLYIGIRYQSSWFETLAFFYIILSTCRLMLLRECSRKEIDIAHEWRQYARVGFSIFFIAVVLALLSNLVVLEHNALDYPGSLIYVVTIYTIYLFIYAVRGLIQFKKYHSPLLSGIKALGFAAVLVGIYSLQASLLSRFGNDIELQDTINSYTAYVIFVLLAGIAFFIIFKSFWNLARINNEKARQRIDENEQNINMDDIFKK